MKRKSICLTIILILALFMCACGSSDEEKAPADNGGTEPTAEESAEPSKDDAKALQMVDGKKFIFTSGAGGWATELTIHADGSFEGEYYDGELGETGSGYPGGTIYSTRFSGNFADIKKSDEFTYLMKLENIKYLNEGQDEIKDGVRTVFGGDAYGLAKGSIVKLYLPGKLLSECETEFLSWVNSELTDKQATKLPFYGLYSTKDQAGFYSENPAAAGAANNVASGTCGENLTWALDNEGTLTISGSGAMSDYGENSDEVTTAPWANYGKQIRKIVVKEGVSSIGKKAFYAMEYSNRGDLFENVKSISLPDSVVTIGDDAFNGSSWSITSLKLPKKLQTIGNNAFSGAQNVTSLTLPENLKTIGNSAFELMPIKSIRIPKSVTSIGEYALGYTMYSQEIGTAPEKGFTIYGFSGSAAETYYNKMLQDYNNTVDMFYEYYYEDEFVKADQAYYDVLYKQYSEKDAIYFKPL